MKKYILITLSSIAISSIALHAETLLPHPTPPSEGPINPHPTDTMKWFRQELPAIRAQVPSWSPDTLIEKATTLKKIITKRIQKRSYFKKYSQEQRNQISTIADLYQKQYIAITSAYSKLMSTSQDKLNPADRTTLNEAFMKGLACAKDFFSKCKEFRQNPQPIPEHEDITPSTQEDLKPLPEIPDDSD